MVSDDERREVAARLRSFMTDNSMNATVDVSHVPYTLRLYYVNVDCIYFCEYDAARLADLIDPTCKAYRDTLFLFKREETVFRCDKCDEIVSYDKNYNPETDLPAYCKMCGSR